MRLHDVYLLVSAILLLELSELKRQDVSFWKEIEVGHPILYLHFGDIFVHEVLASYLKGIRKVVHLNSKHITFW